MTTSELHVGGEGQAIVGLRILVVDDDDEMRRWVRAILELRGARVAEAGSGWELLPRLRVRPGNGRRPAGVERQQR